MALYLCMTHYYVVRIAPWVILSILCSKQTTLLLILMISSIKNGEVVKLYVTQCLHKMKNKTNVTLSNSSNVVNYGKKIFFHYLPSNTYRNELDDSIGLGFVSIFSGSPCSISNSLTLKAD